MNNVIAFTSDLGVEIGLAEAQLGPSLLDWFHPSLRSSVGVQVEEDTGDGQCTGQNEGPEPDHMFANAFPVPGMLHIISNLTMQSHEQSMTHWKDYLIQLRTVANFLHKRWERQAIQADMQRRDASDGEVGLLDKDIPTVTDWRWGCVFHLLDALLPLRGVLPTYFPKDISHLKDTDVDPDVCTAAIHSDLFWAYSRMLMCMHTILHDVSTWCEGCACHQQPGLGELQLQSSVVSSKGEENDLSIGKGYAELLGSHANKVMHASCPMRGRRSAELATGDLRELLKRRISLETAGLRAWLTDSLTADERTLLVHDFLEGVGQISLHLDLKTAFWQQLPWKLCALGHVNASKAQVAALEILHASETSPSDSGVQHRVTQNFLGKDKGSVRDEFLLFSRGQSLDSLPRLAQEVVALMGIPVVERWIERQHSVAKIALGLSRRHGTQAKFGHTNTHAPRKT